MSVPPIRRLARAAWVLVLLALTAGAAPVPLLKDFDGAERNLAEFTTSGRWLVVMLWASDCHVCNVEAKQYVDFHERYRERNAAVLGIALDGYAQRAAARRFIERNEVAFPNLIADAEAIQRWYGELTGEPFFGTPSFLVFAPGGAVAAKQTGAVPVEIIERFIAANTAPTQTTPAPH